jgi:AbrB family looped-hinge helix DNA binding protein
MTAAAADTVWFTSNGRVVIPAKLRRQFNIQNGTRAVVTSTAGGILLKPVTREYISSLRGSLKGRGVLKALAEDRKRERRK